MLTIELPEMQGDTWRDLALEPEVRATKGGKQAPAERLEGWVSLGEPVVLPLTPERLADDPALRDFVAREEFAFCLVHLACSFRPREGEPFANAWLEVLLARADGMPRPLPVAWSMYPRRLEKAVEVSRTVRLGASLKVEDIAGAESGMEQEERWTHHEVYLQALNELQPNPIWEFHSTPRAEIRGLQRLVLVVRAPKAAPAQATVRLSATVRRKRLGIIPYTTAHPGAPDTSFNLP